MKYIIMCGGTYEEWEEPRQLLKPFGESLVKRTIELLKENGVGSDDIFISATDKRFLSCGVPLAIHENSYHARGYNDVDGWWVDAFYPMKEECCYILGDVFFSPNAIKTIVSAEPNDIGIRFFASTDDHAKKSPYFFKRYAEPFAFKVWNQERFRNAIESTKDLAKRGAFNRHPISWELWRVISGRDPLIAYDNYDAICDYTCDIDYKGDIEKLIKCVMQYTKDHIKEQIDALEED